MSRRKKLYKNEEKKVTVSETAETHSTPGSAGRGRQDKCQVSAGKRKK